MAEGDEVWQKIIQSTLALPPQERLAAISSLLVSHPDVAKVLAPSLVAVTSMNRSSATPVAQWLPRMIDEKANQPLVAAVPLDLHLTTAEDVAAATRAMQQGLYVRKVHVDITMDIESIKSLKETFENYKARNR